MAFSQHRSRVVAGNANWSSGDVRWQRGCSSCEGGGKPGGAHHGARCTQQCAVGVAGGRRGQDLAMTTHDAQRRQQAASSRKEAGSTTTACRWGMSWVLIAVVLFVPVAFFITYILAWQLGHIDDPILPFISEAAMSQPVTGIFAELVNIGAVFVIITMYVRYRQVAEYLPPSEFPHHVRVNKAALGIGLAVAFGMTLVANFPGYEDMLVMVVLHTIGALMAFGFGCVYMWMQVPLTFATRPELSSLFVCFVRVVLAILASIIFIFTNIVDRTILIETEEWAKASAACQWTMMTSIVLFLLSYFDEFRYIKIKPAVKVTDRRMSNLV